MKWNLLILFHTLILLPNLLYSEIYNIDFELFPNSREITGRVEISFTANEESDSIFIAAYPNIFSARDEKLNDVTFEWVYPRSFDSGYMELSDESISVNGAVITILKKDIQNEKSDKSIFRYNLARKIKKGEEVIFKSTFLTKIPQKFGSFGTYENILSLNGGFYPRLITEEEVKYERFFPKISDYSIDIKVSDDYKILINGNLLSDGNNADGKYHYEGRFHYPSIIFSKSFRRTVIDNQGLSFIFYEPTQDDELVKWLSLSIAKIVQFLKLEGISLNSSEVKIVSIPLRGTLAINGDGVIYISDRIFKILSSFRYFHDVQFLRAILTYSLDEIIKDREDFFDYFWVREAASWFFTEKYQTLLEKREGKSRDVRSIKLLNYLKFIPAVQEALLAPEYPFSYAYFNSIYHGDNLKEDPANFKRKIPNGRVITEKLKDLLEIDQYNKIFTTYISEKNSLSFGENLNNQLNREMDWFFNDWLSELKRENFSITKIAREKREDKWSTTVEVKRDGKERRPNEVVSLLMKESGDQKHYLRLFGNSEKYEYKLNTENKISLIHLDPYKRLYDKTEKDNRDPAEYLLMMPAANLSLSIFEGDLDGFVYLQLEKMYNPVDSYTFLGVVSPSAYGISLGYGHWFGRLIDFLRMTHFFALDFNFRKLKEGYIQWTGSESVDPDTSPESVYIPVDSGITNSIEIGYSFASTVSRRNPQGGWSTYIFTDLSSKYLLSDYDYTAYGFTFTKLFQLFDEHILALNGRFRDSQFDIPSQNQFSLGGIYNMRGIPAGLSKYVGKKRVLLSCEYRHVLIRELDINIFNLARFRKIQGAVYSDAGSVADTVFEQREKKADPTFEYNNGYGRLVDLNNYNSDIGYSLRFFFDALGVRSTLLRFDIAKQLNNFDDQSLQFYMTFDQAF